MLDDISTLSNLQVMRLFNDPLQNLLPRDGIVEYHGRLMQAAEADRFYRLLLDRVEWRNDEAVIFGKRVITKRKVAWYGDRPFRYTYSGVTKEALPWTPDLLELKALAGMHSGAGYNSCLLNLYHSGAEGMAWHSDGETDLLKHGAIASMSFGAERRFCFKHKQSAETVCLQLEHGSLLVMKGATQDYWLHHLPPTTKVQTPRISLTFRTIVRQ